MPKKPRRPPKGEFKPVELMVRTDDARDLLVLHQAVASGEFMGKDFDISIGVGGVRVNGRESGGTLIFQHGDRRDVIDVIALFKQWLEATTGEKVPDDA